jgi:hypothetical protein
MEVKGTTIKPFIKYIKDKFKDDGYQRWFISLSAESKEIFGHTILASKWYPFQYGMKEPLHKVVELFFGGDISRAKEVGGAFTEILFTGVYKVLLKFGSISFFMSKMSSAISTLYQPIKLESVENKNNKAVSRINEFPEIDETFEYVAFGTIEKILELTGAKNVKVKKNSSLARGDAYTEYEATWE